MSTSVGTSLAGLKATTAQIVGIISRARLMPASTGQAHLALTAQVTNLVAEIVREHEKGPYMPGIIASCSKELIRVRSMTPRVWPNWHSIGHDDPQVLKHSWRSNIHAWEALGDHSGDLPVMPNPSIGPITVDLPSPPIIAGNVTGSSTHATSELRDKGKGKVVVADLEPEVEGSRKRKSPMMSGHSSSPPKSAKKGCKWVKATRNVKPKVFVESEDDEDTIVQPISSGVPVLNVPWPSTIVVGTPHSPHSPCSPKKQLFGPALLIAGSPPKATSGSCLEVVETPQAMSSTPAKEPAVMDTGDILIPGPNNPCHYCTQEKWPCTTRLDRRTRAPCLSCVHCATKKIKCVPASMGSPPKCIRGKSTTWQTRSRTPSRAPSNAPAASQSKARTRSQSRGPSSTPAVPAVTTPKAQSCGHSKTITAAKTPAPAPATIPSSSTAVPRLALDVPIPDLHSMAIAIRDGATRIALLEARVAEQDGKIDTLQRLHEGLCCKVIDRHPSFPLPNSPVNATFLFDQSVPLSISPLPSALTPLIDLDMAGMEPPSLKVQPASVIEPEGPQTSGEIVDPDDPGNLVPEYDSDDMDVEVKVEPSADEGEMAT
ncbi:hypothetical protein BDR07DRAFT_1480527 [Suillus spraguei]|nr:hypothetical protein BDR07DRAFT_1480527 [Suillus spraguei]